MNNTPGSPNGNSHLPSQQPKTKDEFERGYDKGMDVIAATIIDLIDSGDNAPMIRSKMVQLRADNKKASGK